MDKLDKILTSKLKMSTFTVFVQNFYAGRISDTRFFETGNSKANRKI